MARPSLALFLATAGLVAGTLGCGQAPMQKDGGESGEGGTEMSKPADPAMKDGGEAGEGEEAGEGGEGGEAGEG